MNSHLTLFGGVPHDGIAVLMPGCQNAQSLVFLQAEWIQTQPATIKFSLSITEG